MQSTSREFTHHAASTSRSPSVAIAKSSKQCTPVSSLLITTSTVTPRARISLNVVCLIRRSKIQLVEVWWWGVHKTANCYLIFISFRILALPMRLVKPSTTSYLWASANLACITKNKDICTGQNASVLRRQDLVVIYQPCFVLHGLYIFTRILFV